MTPPPLTIASLRIDKLLWHLRLAKSRSVAHAMIEQGHIRLNGRRVEKPSAAVKVADVLTIPLRDTVRVIRLLALPERRGPASAAQSCYEEVTAQPTPPDPESCRP